MYQLDENEENSSTSGKKDSYWARTEELKNCGIESTPVKRNMKRIDDFWEKVRKKDVKNIHNLLPK